jgi:hypothetical protein
MNLKHLFAAAGVLAISLLSAFTSTPPAYALSLNCVNALKASMDMSLSADARTAAAAYVIKHCR